MLEKICLATEKLFIKYGIKSITMDDVAKALSISKKTLYQYVSDKDDLVKKTISIHLKLIDNQCCSVVNQEENAVMQILNIAQMIINMHKDVNPALIYDLKKYHSESYEIFKNHRESIVHEQTTNNLRIGIEQGLYRTDLNIDLTSAFYIGLIELCLSHEFGVLEKTSFQIKFQYLINYHLNAICTEKGKKILEQTNLVTQ